MAQAPSPSEALTTQVRDPEANPIAVAAAMDAATSCEWRDWLPETVRDFAGLGADEVQQLDKLMAVQVGLTNPDAFDTWHLFLACVVAFNHRRVNFEWMDMPSIPELAWGCTVLNRLRPDGKYGPAVEGYIKAAMQHAGLVFFPWVGADGLNDPAAEPDQVDTLRRAWAAGEIKDLEPSEVDPENALHTQLADVVRAQTYIRSQKPEASA